MSVHLVIATEAASATGLGHFIRTSALAEAASGRGWQVTFVLRPDALDYARDRVLEAGWELQLVDWLPDASLVPTRSRGPVVVVVDSYLVNPGGLGWGRLRDRADLLVVVNDGEAPPADVDILLNSNLPAGPHLYPGHQARLLLGTEYTLLREPFRRLRQQAVNGLDQLPRVPRSVLVMLGGTDVSGSTQIMAETAARTFESAQVIAISAELAGTTVGRIDYCAPTPAIAPLMQGADLVISAGGSAIWELACLAKPTAVLVVADNQVPTYRQLTAQKRVIGLGSPPIDPEATRRLLEKASGNLSMLGRALSGLADGRGAGRVLDLIEGMTAGKA